MTSATPPTATENASSLVKLCTTLGIAASIATIAAVVGIYAAARASLAVIAATNSGVVIPAVPLDKPYLNEARVRALVEECLRRSFSHDFVNYRQTMNEAKVCYTDDSHFVEAMDPKIEEMKKNRMVMTNTMPGPPVVVRQRIVGGVFTWELQAEIALGLEGTQTKFTPTRLNVTTTLKRVPLTASTKGALINSIELRPVVGG